VKIPWSHDINKLPNKKEFNYTSYTLENMKILDYDDIQVFKFLMKKSSWAYNFTRFPIQFNIIELKKSFSNKPIFLIKMKDNCTKTKKTFW